VAGADVVTSFVGGDDAGCGIVGEGVGRFMSSALGDGSALGWGGSGVVLFFGEASC